MDFYHFSYFLQTCTKLTIKYGHEYLKIAKSENKKIKTIVLQDEK